MCDFMDMNGTPVNPGDRVEYWSNSYKDWITCGVVSSETAREWDWRSKTIVVNTKITVQPDKGQREYSNHNQTLRSSKNVRKI